VARRSLDWTSRRAWIGGTARPWRAATSSRPWSSRPQTERVVETACPGVTHASST